MRVLMTVDTIGGVWTYAMELAASLSPYGVEFVLASMGSIPTAEQRAQVRALGNARLAVSSFKLEWMPDPWRDVDDAGQWLLGLARRHQVDLVHLNGYAHAALPFGVPLLIVGHSCLLSWWRAVKGEDAPDTWSTYRQRVSAGLAAADAVVAPTSAMLSCLEHHYGGNRRGRVIHNGRRYVAPARKSPYILAAGRLGDEAKNIAALERIAPVLPWPCLAAGDTAAPGGRACEHRALVPLGRLRASELAARLSQAAIFAHPARYEPFGLAPLEAGLAGCALVLGDVPSLREVWGDAAVFVDPDDTDGLRAALMGLIESPELRRRSSAAARRRAGEYSQARMGSAYAQLYGQLAGRSLPAANAQCAIAG